MPAGPFRWIHTLVGGIRQFNACLERVLVKMYFRMVGYGPFLPLNHFCHPLHCSVKKYLGLLVFQLLLSSLLLAQNIDSSLAKLADEFPQEKTYLHFDKSVYYGGDTIWFKAYLMLGLDFSDISKNFYLDWYDDKGNILKHTVNPVFESSARGQFAVPANYEGKYVSAKAYTQWMLNFDTAFLFRKDIPVSIDPTTKKELAAPPPVAPAKKRNDKSAPTEATVPARPAPPKKPKARIHFFPEGGELLKDITCRVAFLVDNDYGLPIEAKGALKNAKGELIDSFVTEHDGMGSFSYQAADSILPVTAYWEDGYGILHETQLPEAKEIGASLEVQPVKGKALFYVNRSAKGPEKMRTLFVVGTMNQHEVYRSKINLKERVSAFGEIPIKDLPTGVLLVTLLDADFDPLAERAVFVNNYKFLFKPEIKFATKSTDRRGKNTVEVSMDDSLFCNMSVAVTDANLPNDASNNIVSGLLLNSEIKGFVNNPAYYFSSKADSVARFLDLVMLTHGWRKIQWKEVAANVYPKINYPKETRYMKLNGQVFGMEGRGSVPNQSIFLIVQGKDSSKRNFFLPIDKAGRFEEPSLFFYDSVYAFYQLAGDKRVTDRVEIKFSTGLLEQFSANVKVQPPPMMFLDQKDTVQAERDRLFFQAKERARKQQEANELSEVVVSTKKKKPVDLLDERYTSGLFSGGDSRQFDVSNDPFSQGAQDVFSYLQGRVAGLQINVSGADVSMSWRGHSPDLYLDEIKTDVDQIRNISMNDIAYVKVFPPPFFGTQSGGAGGAISIYTKRGSDVKPTPGKGLNFKTVAGYTSYREFYNPDYQTDLPAMGTDARTTLYWNPYIMTYKNNNTVRFSFFNNDVTKRFRVVLEGVNADGKLARVEKIIE